MLDSAAIELGFPAAMHRAYSTLTIKDFDDDSRVIEGIASTPTPDRMDDIVVPEGAKFALPLPLLFGHDTRQPIGHVTRATITKEGIEIGAQLAKVEEAGTLKDRLDEAWQSIKIGLVRGLSIGFRSLKDPERIDGTYGYKFSAWEWLELSAVVIPANADASILTAKSNIVRVTDEHLRRVKRRKGAVYLNSPRSAMR